MSIKLKRKLCSFFGWMSFLGVYFVVNNMDDFIIKPWTGGGICFGLLILGSFLLYKAGWIQL